MERCVEKLLLHLNVVVDEQEPNVVVKSFH
jgi:hypothetical protein